MVVLVKEKIKVVHFKRFMHLIELNGFVLYSLVWFGQHCNVLFLQEMAIFSFAGGCTFYTQNDAFIKEAVNSVVAVLRVTIHRFNLWLISYLVKFEPNPIDSMTDYNLV